MLERSDYRPPPPPLRERLKAFLHNLNPLARHRRAEQQNAFEAECEFIMAAAEHHCGHTDILALDETDFHIVLARGIDERVVRAAAALTGKRFLIFTPAPEKPIDV